MATPQQTVQLLVAPVVMISANGLICLALYNRLSAIVSRARVFHKERFDALTLLSCLPLEEQASARAGNYRTRAAALEGQVDRILGRARKLRSALLYLLLAVLAMLTCSLTLGLTEWFPNLTFLPLWLFTAGTVLMMAGVVYAMLELLTALEPVTAEGFAIDDAHRPEV